MTEEIRRIPSCEDLANAQNDHLYQLCSRKVNELSCRCSGCESDETIPVITGPADAPLLNTAYNVATGGFLAAGGVDTQWEAGIGTATGGPGSVTTWIKAPVVQNSAWVSSPFGNANWISFFPNDGLQDKPQVDAYFRYRFNLASSVDPSTFAVTMSFFADNQVAEIFINSVAISNPLLPQVGFPLATDAYSTSGFGKKSGVTLTLEGNWQRCENELIVHVKSGSPYLGFLAQNAIESKVDPNGCRCNCDCHPAKFPDIRPCISVKWGDSECDCLETNDVEVLCITVCNCYSNVTLTDLTIEQIVVVDAAGRPVLTLPDGTPSVQALPSGPICFGDIGPCTEGGRPPCVSRELVLYTRGAVGGNYRLLFRGICFEVCHHYQLDQCFKVKLCRD